MKKKGKYELSNFSTHINPIFDIHTSFDDNMMRASSLHVLIPKIPTVNPTQFHDFLGYKIANRLGVPACPITATSNHIKLLSQLGFSVFTQKTIRSTQHHAYPFPNVVYVEHTAPFTLAQVNTPIKYTQTQPPSMSTLTIANSIGNSSQELTTSLQNISDTRMILQPGQVLAASIYGAENDQRSFYQDWVFLARKVVEAGAHIVEANVSCPNIGYRNALYLDPKTLGSLVQQLVDAINPIPLVIKVGIFPDKHLMEEIMITIARAGARGICGINTLSMQVLDEHNNPVFGEARRTCGVSGASIFNLALDWIQHAYAINKKHDLGLTIVGTGGITLPEQFDVFLYAGAAVAMSGTGTMWNPYLAAHYLQEKYYAHTSQNFDHTITRNLHEHNTM